MKEKKVLVIISIVILVLIIVIMCIILSQASTPPIGIIATNDNMSKTTRAVIVKVNENSLGVMTGDKSLLYVNFSEEGNIGFKQGQEILIYYSGKTQETSPVTLSDVGKIEIIEEKSNIDITEQAIKTFE